MFEAVKETATPQQLYERLNLAAKLDPLDQTPLMKKLLNIISADAPQAHLNPQQLSAALQRPWLAQQLSRLVTYYESEWYADEGLSKWHELDREIVERGGETSLHYWNIDKEQRIKPLLWWPELAGQHGIKADGKAWHFHPVGLVDSFYCDDKKSKNIIFPLKVKPKNDKEGVWKNYYWAVKGDPYGAKGTMVLFGRDRGRGRKHAARDLYTEPFAEVVAICAGKILAVSEFYDTTYEIVVSHETLDNRKFVVRYGEVDRNSIMVRVGEFVSQGQTLGKTGKLIKPDGNPRVKIGKAIVYMLHFEYYIGAEGLDLAKPLTNRSNLPFQRRNDLADPLNILEEGYKNSFELINTNNQINITVAMLKRVFTGLANIATKDALLQEISTEINSNAERYQLNTVLRLSHFFAQVRQEIGSTCSIIEDFTWSSNGLINTFSYFRHNPTEARQYGYSDPNNKYVSSLNQEAIANRAYANRNGNGNIDSGDGWRFKGRGIKHLTGRVNYRNFTNYHRRFWNENTNFEDTPDLLVTNYVYTVRSGVYFWLSNNLANIADQGSTRDIVDNITRVINRNTDSYTNRQAHFERIYTNERIFEDI